jgi:hypothetical protein
MVGIPLLSFAYNFFPQDLAPVLPFSSACPAYFILLMRFQYTGDWSKWRFGSGQSNINVEDLQVIQLNPAHHVPKLFLHV